MMYYYIAEGDVYYLRIRKPYVATREEATPKGTSPPRSRRNTTWSSCYADVYSSRWYDMTVIR